MSTVKEKYNNISAFPKRTIQSLDRAIAIIQLLADAKYPLTLTEMSDSLSLPPQTLQSLLRTLEHHRWVIQPQQRGPYQLGPGIAEIHRSWTTSQNLTSLAEPIVRQLSHQVGEYVILAQWSGNSLMPLLEIQPDRELVVRHELFHAERLHVLACGKLMLALLDEQQQKNIVNTLPMPKCGPNSLTDKKKFLKQLNSIHDAQLAICIEEAAEGIVGIAVPVALHHDRDKVAVGISLPVARYTASRKKKLIADLRNAAHAISHVWI